MKKSPREGSTQANRAVSFYESGDLLTASVCLACSGIAERVLKRRNLLVHLVDRRHDRYRAPVPLREA